MAPNPLEVDIQTSFYTQAVELLHNEAAAIRRCAEHLDPHQLTQAVSLILHCQGHVVLFGVGKSGIVGRKIAATMTSTGTKALYLHATEAMHGDLGVLDRHDVAIAISNSGETEELLTLLPHLRLRRVPLVVIVGRADSSLARQADVMLDAAVDREVCPLNLAPTASTTVALALGDALAMVLNNAVASST